MTDLFKVWDKKWKRWIEGTDVTVYGDGTFTADRRGEDGGDVIETAESRSGELVLLRATQMPDKNGRHIFQDDIVREDGDDRIRVVEWVDWAAGFFYADRQNLDDGQIINESAEVIGNVHSTPELLK